MWHCVLHSLTMKLSSMPSVSPCATLTMKLSSMPNVALCATLTNHEVIIDAKCGAFLGKLHPQRPHHGGPIGLGGEEERIPVGQEGVAGTNGSSDDVGVFFRQQVGLSPLGVQVSMGTEEWLEGSGLKTP